MKKNIGKTDMIIRIIVGIVVGLLGIYFNSWWGLLAILPIVTAFVKWCPLYTIMGVCSCKNCGKENPQE